MLLIVTEVSITCVASLVKVNCVSSVDSIINWTPVIDLIVSNVDRPLGVAK